MTFQTRFSPRRWAGGGAYSFVACLVSHLTIDHASLSRRSTVPTPNRDTSNVWALSTFIPYVPLLCFCLPFSSSFGLVARVRSLPLAVFSLLLVFDGPAVFVVHCVEGYACDLLRHLRRHSSCYLLTDATIEIILLAESFSEWPRPLPQPLPNPSL